MKYAQFDTNGYIIGFYDDALHKTIPNNTIKITNDQWVLAINNQNKYWINKETKLFEEAPPKKISPQSAMSCIRAVRNNKLMQVDIDFRKALEKYLLKKESDPDLKDVLDIINHAQSLRDYPATINLSSDISSDELETLLP